MHKYSFLWYSTNEINPCELKNLFERRWMKNDEIITDKFLIYIIDKLMFM